MKRYILNNYDEGKKLKKKDQRVNNLLLLLQESPDLSVRNLAEMMNVSEMTIRRDLKYLKDNNLFIRSHGIQIPIQAPANVTNIENEYTLHSEQTKFFKEKQKIGQFATTLINPNDTLILDSGTTIAEMSKFIPEHMNLNITCYNYYTLTQILQKEGVQITLAGGLLHKADQMFESSYGNEMIRDRRASKFFLAASGIHEALGITCAHNYEVLTKKAAMSSSLTTILLADSSKFGLIRSAFVAPLSAIDAVITDDGISEEWQDILENMGIKLYIV